MQMAQNNIGSLVVLKPGDSQLIAGIFTERGTKSCSVAVQCEIYAITFCCDQVINLSNRLHSKVYTKHHLW